MASIQSQQQNKKNLLYIDCIAVMLIIILAVLLLIAKNGIRLKPYSINLINNDSSNSALQVSITKHPEKRWMHGDGIMQQAQFDGKITNKMKGFTIKDWEIFMPLPKNSYIESDPWDAVFNLNDNLLHIRQIKKQDILDPNHTEAKFQVLPGSSFTFGLMVHAPAGFDPLQAPLHIQFTPYFQPKYLPQYWLILGIIFTTIIVLLTYANVTRNKLKELIRIRTQTNDFISQTLKLFANTIEAKDTYTSGHSERVALYSKEIARRLGLNEDDQEAVYYAGILHDVGKIGIPDNVLQNKGILAPDEYDLIKSHAYIGEQIFRDFTYLPGIATIIRHHHERYDGTGYPDHLKNIGIPLFSRIIALADAVDAMTTTRCYRKSLSLEVVVEQLIQGSGTQFDPQLIPIMIQMIDDSFVPIQLKENLLESL